MNEELHTKVDHDAVISFLTNYSGCLENGEMFETLSQQMEEYVHENLQSEEERRRKLDFCQLLKDAIHRNRPTWVFDVIPTGSTLNNLGLRNSDLDISIHIPQVEILYKNNGVDFNHQDICFNILRIVRAIIENDKIIEPHIDQNDIRIIPASIQLLHFKTISGIECDVSVVTSKFLSSLHNTFLLRHYTQFDKRFAYLAIIVKEWAKKVHICSPKNGGFNSYAMVLMVIHFLQCGTEPPVLPNLPKVHEGMFAYDDIVFPERLDFNKKLPPMRIQRNEDNLAVMFLRFVVFLMEYDFKKYYVSLRNGCKHKRASGLHSDKPVFIEDPFDDHNPGRTVHLLEEIQNICRTTVNLFTAKKNVKLEHLFRK